MPRNKYPEETEKKILDAAYELFISKGYENTSIQDIIDKTKLSKGAVYHHFVSKESILLAVFGKASAQITEESTLIIRSKEMNGLQKIQAMFLNVFTDNSQMKLMNSMPNLLNNPHLLALYMKVTINEITPKFFYPVLKEGIQDGSIVCKHPCEAAEALTVLSNVWMNPLIYDYGESDVIARFDVLNQMLSGFGIEITDEKVKSSVKEAVYHKTNK